MIIAAHRQLRRHRRALLWALSVLALVTVALTVKAALPPAHVHGHEGMESVVTACVTVTACVAVVAAGAVAVRRVLTRPVWALGPSGALLPGAASVAAPVAPSRAGPAPALSRSVLRL